jgi:hypothetical protein
MKYMVTYRCEECGMESSYAEKDQPVCRNCEKETIMTFVMKQEITAELLEQRIKALSESMLTNLQKAYEQMSEDDKLHFPDGQDAEKEMLVLLSKMKNLKDKIEEMQIGKKEE